MTKTHHTSEAEESQLTASPYTTGSKFLPTSQRILQFTTKKEAKEGDVVGYMAGAFDLFHLGHIKALQEAKKHCDYLVVGLHTDSVVNHNHGSNYPIMNLNERTLAVLSCRYVDEVLIGAPAAVTTQIIDYFKIKKVFHGKTEIVPLADSTNPYQVAMDKGLMTRVDSGCSLT